MNPLEVQVKLQHILNQSLVEERWKLNSTPDSRVSELVRDIAMLQQYLPSKFNFSKTFYSSVHLPTPLSLMQLQ